MASFHSMPVLSSGATPEPDAMAIDAFASCMNFEEPLL